MPINQTLLAQIDARDTLRRCQTVEELDQAAEQIQGTSGDCELTRNTYHTRRRYLATAQQVTAQ
jgi:soluble cytochrome b562